MKEHLERRNYHNIKSALSEVPLHLLLIVGGATMIMPFLWMISTAFKPASEIIAYPLYWIPKEPTLDNFIEVFNRAPFLRYFLNTIIVTSSVVIAGFFFCSLTGYVLAKLDLPGGNLILLMILAKIMVPFQVLMVPLFLLVARLGIADSLLGLIVPTDMISAFGIFMMRQFIIDIPDELLDAARIDGCSEFGIYYRIILPCIKAPLATLGIFLFMWTWGNFLWPLIVIISPEKRTLELGLAMFKEWFWVDYGPLMAATLLSLIPVIIFFVVLQRKVIESVSMTGLRG